MRLLVAGDTHGNTAFIADYLYACAIAHRVDAIVQVGDFGFWEHTPDGVEFLDAVSFVAAETGIPLYALHGNHDNWPLVMDRYGGDRNLDWFVRVREDHVHYIPQGHIWTWAGHRMRAFGGAYSIDKQWRLDLERKRWRALAAKEEGRRQAGQPPKDVPSTAGTIWFPDEQMTDAEFAELMILDPMLVDIVFSHDKPRSSDPGLKLKDEPECRPNQDRLQLALTTHRPQWWFHGHLHHPYRDTVQCGDDEQYTTVIGLGCDSAAAGRFWKPTDAWCLLDLTPNGIIYTSGADVDDVVAPG